MAELRSATLLVMLFERNEVAAKDVFCQRVQLLLRRLFVLFALGVAIGGLGLADVRGHVIAEMGQTHKSFSLLRALVVSDALLYGVT